MTLGLERLNKKEIDYEKDDFDLSGNVVDNYLPIVGGRKPTGSDTSPILFRLRIRN
jgi:hypothetical protein